MCEYLCAFEWVFVCILLLQVFVCLKKVDRVFVCELRAVFVC